jgi:hypothetical protein
MGAGKAKDLFETICESLHFAAQFLKGLVNERMLAAGRIWESHNSGLWDLELFTACLGR